ncbi:hypothetical protein GGTG_13530 [Gaeumannomyces tritici R3-111a-1]|uniref:JmjC domain-containing protein n=1 Tax=Gaeumannomyces tritici (strain R3-111a-1) TaxID=644352 RepID=J3PJ48_GAET3|nr:hypothetical protein GGTG_13530 [Gaeumannomyces tritici R3-111a-1]EJT68942.1 hypothetical protein GGTG_13530 [Gaeumannomyces tritici R3-111a-1]
MAAESQDLVNFTLTKAQFEQLPAEARAFLNATKSASRSAGRRAAAITNQGLHQQAEEQVQEQQKEEQLQTLLASFPQEKLSYLLTPFLAQLKRQPQAKQDGSQFGYEPREADSEVSQLKNEVARLEQQLQAKEQDEEDKRMRRLLAETDKTNKRLQAEVERLKKEAEENAKLAEQQKRPGVPPPSPAAEPPALAFVSLPAPTRDGQAVPASNDSVQAVPDSNAGGDPSNDHDEAGAGPLPISTAAPPTANSGSAGSSGSPSSPASVSSRGPPSDGQPLADIHTASSVDPEGSPEIDMLDADSPSSRSGAETRAADHSPQSISHHKGRATAGILAAALSDSEGQHGDKVIIEHSSAAPFTSATFRPTRKQLPNGRTRSQVDAAPQVQSTLVPPPPSGQGNNNPATFHEGVKYQWRPCEGDKILVLEPSLDQYSDLKEGPEDRRPLLFTVAENLGARNRGAVVIKIPEECRPVLPPQPAQTKKCTTYRPMPVKDDFWRLYTVYETQTLPSLDGDTSGVGSGLTVAVGEHERRISEASKEDPESIKGVAYLTDIPAHSAQEREDALLPPESPIWHIRDNKLPREGVPGRPCVPGLHTPTAYRGTKSAPFAWHLEDLSLGAINLLYIGRKVWFVTEPASSNKATGVFSNALGAKADHDQFLRHQALHGGIEHLRNKGVSTIGFMQEPWEMVIVYPGAYHSGFSVTDTLAEAVNYADRLYTFPKMYKPCDERCHKDQEPITRELVFPSEAEIIPVGEAGSAVRRSSRQIATLLPAPAKNSMGSPRGPQKRKRSTGEPGLARHTGQRNSKSHEPENRQGGLQDEPPAKQKKNTPSSQAIAEELTGPHAIERIMRYARSWKEWHSSPVLPTLANKQTQPHDATSEGSKYLELGWDWEEKAEISKIVGALLATHGLKKLYDIVPGGMYNGSRVRQLPTALSDKVRAGLRTKLSDDAFRSKLKRLRKFLKIGEDYLPFMSCATLTSSSAALGHLERLADDEIAELRDKLDSDLKAKIFAAMGSEFRTMILKTLGREPDTTHIDRVLELLANNLNGWSGAQVESGQSE